MESHRDPEATVRELLARGEVEGAAAETIRWLGPGILGALGAMLQSEKDASEAFSDVAAELGRDLAQLRPATSIRAWAYRLALQAARRPRRRATSYADLAPSGGIVHRIHIREIAPPGEARDPLREALSALRSGLDVEEHLLLYARTTDALTWAELGQVLAREGEAAPREKALRRRLARLRERIATLARGRGPLE